VTCRQVYRPFGLLTFAPRKTQNPLLQYSRQPPLLSYHATTLLLYAKDGVLSSIYLIKA